ncbi:hypothetical protein LXL04_006679 [Taraxacum kok-saghyz]
MSSNREWMYTMRADKNGIFNPEFQQHVKYFLDFAYTNANNIRSKNVEGETILQIRCPCSECKNRCYKKREMVVYDIYYHGFMGNYSIWYAHGETFPTHEVGECSNPIPSQHVGQHIDHEMAQDIDGEMDQDIDCGMDQDIDCGMDQHRNIPALRAHTYILLNCAEVAPYVDEFDEVAPNLYPDDHISCLRDKYFAKWFKNRVMDNSFQGNQHGKHLEILARKPSRNAKSYKGYFVNGYKYHTREYGKGRVTSNSGVCVRGETYNAQESDYYGILEEILELEYCGNEHSIVLMFKCVWFDNNQGVVVNKNKLVDVKHKSRLQTDDPFILASQAEQVFYTSYPGVNKETKDLWAVVKVKPRGIYEVAPESEVENDENLEVDAMFQIEERFELPNDVTSSERICLVTHYNEEFEDEEFQDEEDTDIDEAEIRKKEVMTGSRGKKPRKGGSASHSHGSARDTTDSRPQGRDTRDIRPQDSSASGPHYGHDIVDSRPQGRGTSDIRPPDSGTSRPRRGHDTVDSQPQGRDTSDSRPPDSGTSRRRRGHDATDSRPQGRGTCDIRPPDSGTSRPRRGHDTRPRASARPLSPTEARRVGHGYAGSSSNAGFADPLADMNGVLRHSTSRMVGMVPSESSGDESYHDESCHDDHTTPHSSNNTGMRHHRPLVNAFDQTKRLEDFMEATGFPGG